MSEGTTSYVNLFADDAKIMRRITNEGNCEALNQDLDKIQDWSSRWNMEFNIKKCSVMEVLKSERRISGSYLLGDEINKRTEEKDLEVTISHKPKFEKTHNYWRNL